MENPPKPTILDNRSLQTSVGGYLQAQLADGSKILRIVSAYFTVYAYDKLRKQLKNTGTVRFLYGDPGSVGEIDPGIKPRKGFDLTERGLSPTQVLQQKCLARECAEWIEKKVKVRTVRQLNFLHGKIVPC